MSTTSRAPERSLLSVAAPVEIRIAIHGDLASVEHDWRAFEQVADCTVFQSFEWVSLWQRHVGERQGVKPAIVTGRDSQGKLLCLLPLSIEPGSLGRRLTWFGNALCDYNAPLLAQDFGQRVDEARFKDGGPRSAGRCRPIRAFASMSCNSTRCRRVVGAQANPFMTLGPMPHANGAYLTTLGTAWESFYNDASVRRRRRRRDRTKRRSSASSASRSS